jgi:hypothetical protein
MNHLLEQRRPQDPSTNLNNHLISKESLTMWTINIMKTGHKIGVHQIPKRKAGAAAPAQV